MDAITKSKRLIYLASQNQNKLEELRDLLSALPIEIHLVDELGDNITWEETGSTFVDNARIKARSVKAHTSHCVLADDSGLEVNVLGGAPGVYSARYAGPDATDEKNNAKLLNAMQGQQDRRAHFTCCLCFIDESGAEQFFMGHLNGEIGHEACGQQGFGYDPLFMLPDQSRSLAELSPTEKNSISHRYAAVEKFRAALLKS